MQSQTYTFDGDKSIFSLYKIDPNNIDAFFRNFSLVETAKEAYFEIQELSNLLVALINTNINLFSDCQWEDNEYRKSGNTAAAILSMLKKVNHENKNSKVFPILKFFRFNSDLQLLGDESTFVSSDNTTGFYKEILRKSGGRNCDLEATLSRFYNLLDENAINFLKSNSIKIHSLAKGKLA